MVYEILMNTINSPPRFAPNVARNRDLNPGLIAVLDLPVKIKKTKLGFLPERPDLKNPG